MGELIFNLETVKSYAEKVHRHPRTVRRWIEEGKLKAKKDRGGRGWLILIRNVRDFIEN